MRDYSEAPVALFQMKSSGSGIYHDGLPSRAMGYLLLLLIEWCDFAFPSFFRMPDLGSCPAWRKRVAPTTSLGSCPEIVGSRLV